MIKICPVCKKKFKKKSVESMKYWDTKIYCSYKCYRKVKFTNEHKKNLSLSHIGQIAWNKGKEYLQIKGKKHPNWKGGKILLICKTCGKKFKVGIYRKNIAKYCSRKCKTDDNLGLTSINEKERRSKKYKEWRKAVFQRDNYTCQKCGQIGGKLNADHIKPFAYFLELRFDINNGRTLCKDCHKQTDTFGIKAWRNYKKDLVAATDNI